MKISIYDSIKDSRSQATIDINNFLRDIKEGRWQDQVLAYRVFFNKYKNELIPLLKYKKNKRKSEILDLLGQKKAPLPNATINGVFAQRNNQSLKTASGFIAFDVDYIANIPDLSKDPYVYSVFRSVSGFGFCIIIRCRDKLFKEYYTQFAAYLYDKYDIEVDPLFDVARTRFISYDPDMHYNPMAKLYEVKKHKEDKTRRNFTNYVSNDDDFNRCIDEIVRRGIDITYDYHEWIKLGFLFYDKFGEFTGLDYYHKISQFHPGYCQQKTDRKWQSIMRHCNNSARSVTDGTFYYLCAREGINIKSDRTAKIERIARIVKKNGAPIAEIDKQLQTEGESTLTDNERRFAEAVKVDAPDKDRDTIGETRAWLNLKRDIWKCNIRNRFYDGDEPINDSHINMLWELINADGIKASKDVVTNLVTSKLAKVKDPLREFFEHNQEEGTDLILKLCQCVPTDDPEWRDIALIRWLMGTMETLYVRPVPYCPVLTGEQETGKTSFSRYLLPPELSIFYVESTLNEGKDSMIQLTENFIILNDEFTVKDMNHYKNLLSKSKVKVRAPYGRFEEERPRIGNLIGTSNEDEIIEDHTGNRRIFPIKVTGMIDFKLYESIDKKRLWGQVFYCWVNKVYPVELSRSEREKLANMTKSYQVTELLDDYLESIYEHDEENFTPTVHIYEELKDRFKQQITKASLGRAMRRAGFQKVREKDGQRRWGYAISKRHELPTPTDQAPF